MKFSKEVRRATKSGCGNPMCPMCSVQETYTFKMPPGKGRMVIVNGTVKKLLKSNKK